MEAAWNTGVPTRAALRMYTVGRAVCVAYCYSWFRASVQGRERVPAEGAFILAPVHRSNIDTPLAATVTRRPLRYMGKDSLFRNRALGWTLSALGGFPVSRGTADRDALKRCQHVLETGQILVLFPEGTRKFGPVVEDLFDGAAYLAMKAQVPILPVGIGGSEAAQAKGQRFVRPVKVRLIVGNLIQPPPPGIGKAARAGMAEVTTTLQAELQRLLTEAQGQVGR